ncbi:MAG TPA: radical SAM protein [Anaerolineae bacterium]|nr:radical SAM protein [Anaerolineae bacterium]
MEKPGFSQKPGFGIHPEKLRLRRRFVKIRLIEPRPPGINVFDSSPLPRLGLPIIGTLLHQQGHDVRIYVEMLAPIDWADVGKADLLGLSATTSTAPAAYAIAERAHQLGLSTVIGGPHVTFLPDEALDHCDFVVRGEGQETMLELVEALEAGHPLNDIAGLSFRDQGGEVVHNPDRPLCSEETYAALPWPDLDLIVGQEKMPVTPIMTQWGCPFNCDFCSVIRMFGRRVRARTVEDVLAELEARQPEIVFFYDDNFVADKRWTKQLLRGMIERGLTPLWSAQMRAEAVYADKRTGELDHELLGLMRDSGCTMIYCGFESVNEATLQAYNKRQTVQDIQDSIRALHAYDIRVHGMFVLGSDEDDVATIHHTADFALENNIDTVQFLILTPCPGTPFYERVVEAGRVLSFDWSLYDGFHVLVRPPRMSPYELQIETYRAMARFYSPRQIVRLAIGGVIRNIPFLMGLLWREWRLSVQLPRLAFFSMLPGKRTEVINILRRTLSRRNRELLQRKFMVPLLRQYGHHQIVRWAQQARSQAYVAWLKRLSALSGLERSTVASAVSNH